MLIVSMRIKYLTKIQQIVHLFLYAYRFSNFLGPNETFQNDHSNFKSLKQPNSPNSLRISLNRVHVSHIKDGLQTKPSYLKGNININMNHTHQNTHPPQAHIRQLNSLLAKSSIEPLQLPCAKNLGMQGISLNS